MFSRKKNVSIEFSSKCITYFFIIHYKYLNIPLQSNKSAKKMNFPLKVQEGREGGLSRFFVDFFVSKNFA